MSFLPQAKCKRCDRTFSGLRARCPYCGARRSSKGKRVTDTDNSTWKLVIGILLMVVLIAAVIVLLVSGKDEKVNEDKAGNQSGISTAGDNVSSVDGTDPDGGIDSSGSTAEPDDGSSGETGEPIDGSEDTGDDVFKPTAESVSITYLNRKIEDFTMKTTEDIQLGYKTVPDGVESTAVWESSDSKVFVVLQSGLVTAIGKGNATLTVTVDGATASCVVRVK